MNTRRGFLQIVGALAGCCVVASFWKSDLETEPPRAGEWREHEGITWHHTQATETAPGVYSATITLDTGTEWQIIVGEDRRFKLEAAG